MSLGNVGSLAKALQLLSVLMSCFCEVLNGVCQDLCWNLLSGGWQGSRQHPCGPCSSKPPGLMDCLNKQTINDSDHTRLCLASSRQRECHRLPSHRVIQGYTSDNADDSIPLGF